MRRFSAQFVITNSGTPAKRAVITTEDDGTIISIEENKDSLKESQSVEFYNGIIIPGFVNCHCHLELSCLKGAIPEGTGLGNFIMQVRETRKNILPDEISAAKIADNFLGDEGVVFCADVCNTSVTFDLKKNGRIHYHNFLEVFGIDPQKAGRRMDDISEVATEADGSGLPYSIVPHSSYAVSLPLLKLIKEKTDKNRVTSIHFMESEGEARFLSEHRGPLRKSYEDSGLLPEKIQTPPDHTSTILNEVTRSGNLILVHNTFAETQIVREIQKRGSTFWCLCPRSNLYIEKKMPPVEMLVSEGCEIVIGTDSLASNKRLSILSELKLIQQYFPAIALEKLLRWATINGARALCKDNCYGKIEPGKKPGLLLLKDVDLLNFKLLPETTVTRLL
ncbi:MAG: amidohydrolase family protein [Bacteroidia bacterium]|nr:amidohydrolase family protein [Bacteroidia bacterium]